MTQNCSLKNSIIWLKFLVSSGVRLLGCLVPRASVHVAASSRLQGWRQELLSRGPNVHDGSGWLGPTCMITTGRRWGAWTQGPAHRHHCSSCLSFRNTVCNHATWNALWVLHWTVFCLIQMRWTVKMVDDVDCSPTQEYVHNSYRIIVSTSQHLNACFQNSCNHYVFPCECLKFWVRNAASCIVSRMLLHPAATSLCQRNRVG